MFSIARVASVKFGKANTASKQNSENQQSESINKKENDDDDDEKEDALDESRGESEGDEDLANQPPPPQQAEEEKLPPIPLIKPIDEISMPKDFNKPWNYEAWIRCIDAANHIFYYNVLSAENSWLAPCSVCYKPSNKWCFECATSLCDKHYSRKHYNNEKLKGHKWAVKEPGKRPALTGEEVYCMECNLNIASKLCTTCWDPYCDTCFTLVHHVGQLRYHVGDDYFEAKRKWYKVRAFENEPEYFVNGETNESTYDRPRDLMTDLERELTDKYEHAKEVTEESVERLEQLQYDYEKATYEFEVLKEEVFEMEKQNKKGGKKQSINMKKGEQSEYVQKLMTPNPRRRGQARNNYIKSLLDKPIPGQK